MVFEKKNFYLINKDIKFDRLLLIKNDGLKKEVSRIEALNIAEEENFDLVCVSPNAPLPVCKLINYKKYLFELGKKNKKKTKKVLRKVIKLHLNTNKRDLLIKIDKIKSWINSGESIIKIILYMVGRENNHPEFSYEKCIEIANEIKKIIPFVELKDDKIDRASRSFYFYIQKKSNSGKQIAK